MSYRTILRDKLWRPDPTDYSKEASIQRYFLWKTREEDSFYVHT